MPHGNGLIVPNDSQVRGGAEEWDQPDQNHLPRYAHVPSGRTYRRAMHVRAERHHRDMQLATQQIILCHVSHSHRTFRGHSGANEAEAESDPDPPPILGRQCHAARLEPQSDPDSPIPFPNRLRREERHAVVVIVVLEVCAITILHRGATDLVRGVLLQHESRVGRRGVDAVGHVGDEQAIGMSGIPGVCGG